MGRYYVQQAFNGDAKEYAETIIKSAIQAFKDRLPELDWLDDSSRAGAEEKASAIGIKIGYPTAAPDTRSAVALRRHYAGVPSPAKGRYFEAVMDVRTQDERRKWLGVGKAREGWEMVPTEVNAYYQPQANEMVFPAGILQAPYFSKDYPEYLGFGSMASLAGHELTVSRQMRRHARCAGYTLTAGHAASTPLTPLDASSTRRASSRTGGPTTRLRGTMT